MQYSTHYRVQMRCNNHTKYDIQLICSARKSCDFQFNSAEYNFNVQKIIKNNVKNSYYIKTVCNIPSNFDIQKLSISPFYVKLETENKSRRDSRNVKQKLITHFSQRKLLHFCDKFEESRWNFFSGMFIRPVEGISLRNWTLQSGLDPASQDDLNISTCEPEGRYR